MIVGGSSPGPGRTTAPSSVTVLPAAMRPVIAVPPTRAAVNLPCEKTAKGSAAPSEKHAAVTAVGGGAASGPAGRASAQPTATAPAAHANNPARRAIHLRYAAARRSVKPHAPGVDASADARAPDRAGLSPTGTCPMAEVPAGAETLSERTTPRKASPLHVARRCIGRGPDWRG